jgi:hypothetical protein
VVSLVPRTPSHPLTLPPLLKSHLDYSPVFLLVPVSPCVIKAGGPCRRIPHLFHLSAYSQQNLPPHFHVPIIHLNYRHLSHESHRIPAAEYAQYLNDICYRSRLTITPLKISAIGCTWRCRNSNLRIKLAIPPPLVRKTR